MAAQAAAIVSHQQCDPIDQDAVAELQAKLSIAADSKQSSETALLMLHLFYRNVGNYEAASSILKKIGSKSGTESYIFLAYSGTFLFHNSASMKNIKVGADFCDKALKVNPNGLEALFGKARSLRMLQKGQRMAMEIINRILVLHTGFIPVHIERMYLFLEEDSWDQAVEAAERLLKINDEVVDALAIVALNDFVKSVAEHKLPSSHLLNLLEVCKKYLLIFRRFLEKNPIISRHSYTISGHSFVSERENKE